jgi:hypothetical protein
MTDHADHDGAIWVITMAAVPRCTRTELGLRASGSQRRASLEAAMNLPPRSSASRRALERPRGELGAGYAPTRPASLRAGSKRR